VAVCKFSGKHLTIGWFINVHHDFLPGNCRYNPFPRHNPLVIENSSPLKVAIEFDDLPMKNGGSFHRFLACLPEATPLGMGDHQLPQPSCVDMLLRQLFQELLEVCRHSNGPVDIPSAGNVKG